MSPRMTVLISLLVLSVFVAGGTMWFFNTWNAKPKSYPVVIPPKPEPVETPATIQKGEPAPMGKINIDEVCSGALAYMTFSDAAAADTFVEDCKAGKHPEVIEQYKASLNLGDGAAI